jgi:hypothetical protein
MLRKYVHVLVTNVEVPMGLFEADLQKKGQGCSRRDI